MKNYKFFSLSNGQKRGALHASMSHKSYNAENVFYGSATDEHISLSFLQGKNVYDIVGCGYGFIYAVSPRFIQVLKEFGFSGWKSYPVEYNGKMGDLSNYEILSVTGECGEIINERSEKRHMPPRVSWGEEYNSYFGLFFDESSWDGSDFFHPKGTYHIFITERVKVALYDAQLTNLAIMPTSDIENINLW